MEVPVDDGMLAEGGRFVFTFTRVGDSSAGSAVLSLDDIGLAADTLPDPQGIGPALYAPRLSLYPNPAERMVFVTLGDAEGGWSLEVHDALGRCVMDVRSAGPTLRLDVSRLPAGPYFLCAGGAVVRLLVVR